MAALIGRGLGSSVARSDARDAKSSREAEPSAADLVRDMLTGRACMECGDPLQGSGCPTCAEKQDLLRQVFARTHGDA